MSARRRIVQAGIILCVLAVGAVIGLHDPTTMRGGAGWSLIVLAVLWGYGVTLQRVLRITLGPGEQMLLGTVIFVLLGGWLLAFGVASRIPLLVVSFSGVALAGIELVRRARVPATDAAPRDIKLVHWILGGAVVVYLTLTLIGEVAARGNPYDDHVAYTAFVKRLLDCGDLTEPYSFRRISAYGGQTVLLALAALRGDVESSGLLDRGIFAGVVVLLILDLARNRRLHIGATTLIVVFLFSLWDLSSNSASAWTGLACYLGAYAFATNDELSPRTSLLLTFAACATACTLRQNYLVPAGLFAALVLVMHLRKVRTESSWLAMLRSERRTILVSIGAAVAIVLPYMIAVWQSNHTFLYPILLGTGNPVAPLQPAGFTAIDELSFFFAVIIESEPIRIWWILMPFMVLAVDTRARKPFTMFLIAALVGFVVMVHSFTLSEGSQLWRYASGYMTTLGIVFLIEVSTRLQFIERSDRADDPPPLRVSTVGIILVWLSVLVQLVVWGRSYPAQRLRFTGENIKAAMTLGSAKIADHRDLYPRLQATLPEGAPLVVMLDDPYLLDYDRNVIFNLDLVGFSAPAPGLPSFLGAERWRSYFASQGIRYLAFVDARHATYLYTRESWISRMFNDGELWRFLSSHTVDASNSFEELAKTSRVLFHEDSVTLLDLGENVAVADASGDAPELLRQDQFLRRHSETEFGDKTWQLSSRSDVVFQPDGYGPGAVQFEHPHRTNSGGSIEHGSSTVATAVLNGALLDILGRTPPVVPHRWLTDRTHVRVHGNGGAYRLHLKLDTDVVRLATIPTVIATLDGRELGRVVATPDGDVVLDATATCQGWCDLYITCSTMSEFWFGADSLKAIKLLELEWLETRR